MWNTFKYTVLSLVKEKNILIWALAFPLILASLFNIMFGDLDQALKFNPIPTAVVQDANYDDAEVFSLMIDNLSEETDDQVLITTFVSSADDAEALLEDGSVVGYYAVDGEGDPSLFITTSNEIEGIETVNQTILKSIIDNFERSRATVDTLLEENPAALADPETLDSLFETGGYTEEISITPNEALSAVRYFYALLGFAAIMAANVSMTSITRTQANLSALGARRGVGATSRLQTLTATLLASWLLAFLCLVVAFGYMRFVLGIDFGGRDAACILGIAVASLFSTSLGAAIGSLPKLPEGAKAGILTGLSCMLALFAGLYGASSMRLADDLTRTAPVVQMINPSKQIGNLFYSLYYYDTFDQFAAAIFMILGSTAVLFVIAAFFMRRQRYASI